MDRIKKEIEEKILSLKDTNIELYNILIKFISIDNWIEDIPLDVFVNVLTNIGYSKEVAINYYKNITLDLAKQYILKNSGEQNEI